MSPYGVTKPPCVKARTFFLRYNIVYWNIYIILCYDYSTDKPMVSQKIDIGYIQIAYQFPGQSLLKKL